MADAEAQHAKKRRRPIWLILLILFFLCILIFLCWMFIWPRLQPPAATETPTDVPIVTETDTETETPTATDIPDTTEDPNPQPTETETATATCVPGTEGCAEATDELPTDIPTATDTPLPPEPPDLVLDPFDPDFQLEWDANCTNYSVSADLTLLAQNQGSGSSSAFAVSFAVYDETKQTALSDVSRVDFSALEAGTSETQSSTLTLSISRSQIQVSHNNLYLIVEVDPDNVVDEVDETNNRLEIPIGILACGKGA